MRRGLARGEVSAEKASELVEQHVEGSLSTKELKFGVGYVPPPPENYEEVSARLDAARREAAGPHRARTATTTVRHLPGAPRGARCRRPSDADLDGYVLGAFLWHSATERTRKLLRISGEADAHEYARALHPGERLSALRSFAREAIDAI